MELLERKNPKLGWRVEVTGAELKWKMVAEKREGEKKTERNEQLQFQVTPSG